MESETGFFDERNRGLFDVTWVVETGLECIDFATEFQDTVLEVCFVLGMNIFWNLEIDVAVLWNGKAETRCICVFDFWNARCFGEMLNQKLIIRDELIVVEGNWVALGAWETLEVAADAGDDID